MFSGRNLKKIEYRTIALKIFKVQNKQFEILKQLKKFKNFVFKNSKSNRNLEPNN